MKDFTFFKSLVVLLTLGFTTTASAQLTVDFELTPEEMAQNLVGEGVEIFNVSVNAADSSYAYYTSVGTEIGTSEGILLTTGNAINAIGPNDETGLPIIDGTDCLNCDEYDNDFPGSELLTLANGGLTTWDATTFEFDIVPQGDSLRFAFNFASEEYLEWVGSSFNDVFGFFITGPGVGVDVNIALIPETSTAVAINNVNHIDNTQYFFDNQNPLGQEIQYDGFTVGIDAEVGGLTPCETYRLKLIIADGSDHLYDSGVFISQIESNPLTITTSTVGGSEYMVEGCNDGTVVFESTFVPTEDLEVNFTLDGTAEFGVDYTTVPDLDLFYDAIEDIYTLIIPPGETSVSFDILPIFDNIDEVGEFVNISLVDQTCDGFEFQSSVDFNIIDEITATVNPTDATICNGQCVLLDGEVVTDGIATFEWTPEEGITDPSLLDIEVCPSVTTTYTLTNTLASCVTTASATVTVTAPEITFDVTNITCTDGDTGEIDVTVTNATDPISYEWTFNGAPFSADEDLTGLEEGEYCVTIVDDEGCTNEACVDVIEDEVLNIINVEFSDTGCGNQVTCAGECDGSIEVTVTGGTGIYTFVWVDALDAVVGNAALVENLCAGDYTVTVTDENGCEDSQTYTINEPDPLTIDLVGQVDILCTGEETGVATVTALGGCPPYFYNWSHDPNISSPVATNLPAGTITVTVSDSNGCTSDDSVVININAPSAPIDVTLDNVSVYPGGFNVSCPDASDGTIDISITGGTGGYTPVWVHIPTGDTYFTEDLAGVPCGEYELTVTDDNDCTFFLEVVLTCVPDWNVSADITPNPCGDPNAGIGEIDLTISGSHGGPYDVQWIGPSCPCSGPTITGLISGDYTATITDNEGCIFVQTFNVGTNDQFSVTETITDATCGGECDGSIELDITAAVETTTWTGPDGFTSSDEDIFDLCAGTYEVTITDSGCEETFTYVVNQPDPIVVDFDNIIPPVCFGQNNGSVTANATGGTGILSYEWSPSVECFFAGSVNQTISNLFECTYVVTVTDETGCSVQDSIFLDAPQVMDIFVTTTLFDGGYNVSCPDASDGEISVTVSGGSPDCVLFDPECYEYDWTQGDPVNSPGSSFQAGLPAGSYQVEVTDANGCVASTIIPMIAPDEIQSSGTVSDYNGFGVSCNGECDGFITPQITGGSGNYVVYEWISGDIGDNNPEAVTLTDLCPGTYELRIVDTNDCEEVVSFELLEPEPLDLTVDNVTDVTCFGYTDGFVSVTGTGGVPTYDYNWNDGQYIGNVLPGIGADTLALVMTDLNGCTLLDTVIVNQPDTFLVSLFVPTLEDSPFSIPCVGEETGSIITTIQGGEPDFDIIWSGDGIVNINDQNQQNLPAGTYDILVIDETGCEATASAEITEPEFELEVSSVVSSFPGGFEISCFGACDGSIDLTVTGGVEPYTFLWELNNGGGEFAVTEDVEDLCPGLYEVLVSDANGCDTLLTFTLTEPEELLLNPDFVTYEGGFNVSCPDECDGEVTFNPSGGIPPYFVNWTLNGGPVQNDLTITGLCAGDVIEVTLNDDLDCEIVQTLIVNAPEELALNAEVNNISCFGEEDGSIQLNVTGGAGPYTYVWTPNVGSDDLAEDLPAGTDYCVEVTDANGCTVEGCFDITEPEELTVDLTGVNATCEACDGSVLVDANGGTGDITITWDGPTDVPVNSTSGVDLCPGDYTITVTDENGCSDEATITIDGDPGFGIVSNVTQPSCFGDCDGGVELSIDGGTPEFTTVWTVDGEEVINGDGVISITDICSGELSVTVTDAAGCENSETWTIIEPTPIVINGSSPLYADGYNVSGFGVADGSIETDVMGGTPGYLYSWEGPSSVEDGLTNPQDLAAGEYTLTIIDLNGCEKDSIIVVTSPDDLTLPTGFSPNGDNANDTFVILGIDQYPNNTFVVFNRWGNIVYEKSNYMNEWNGTNSDGEELPDGTYFVVFEAAERQFSTYVDLRR